MARPTLSDDGRWLAWSAPLAGVANVWVAPRQEVGAARPITREARRAPSGFAFARDGRHLLFLKDGDGDENTHLFSADLDTGEIRDLTPYPGARSALIAMGRRRPGHVLVRINDRDARYPDVYEIELATGERKLVERNDDGYAGYLADQDHRLLLARIPTEDGGAVIRRRDPGGTWADWLAIAPEDANTTRWSHLDATARQLFLYDSRGRDTSALTVVDLETNEARVVAEDPSADIDGMILDPQRFLPLAWAGGDLHRRYHAIGATLAPDIARLDGAGLGDWSPLAVSGDLDVWLIAAATDVDPITFWVYERGGGEVKKLFDTRPGLAGMTRARTHGLRLPARDGLPLTAYLTLPTEFDTTAPGQAPTTASPAPLVVVVHGGPASRDRFGFDAEAQWLADRGYATLKVNYRGSAGFGKAFLTAGNLQWGLAMSDDVDDAVDWVVCRGLADPERVAITGGSYGGYAVLVALTRTPTRYACGVDLVGPSDLETLVATVPAYWAAIRKTWLLSVGDPETPEGRQSLRERSPLHRADRIARPLLIGHGANDPRVKQAEADQMVEAMLANAVPVTYAVFPDEGHGFGRPVNALCFAALKELFLARCLGGRVEPMDAEVRTASSLELRAGGEWLAEE